MAQFRSTLVPPLGLAEVLIDGYAGFIKLGQVVVRIGPTLLGGLHPGCVAFAALVLHGALSRRFSRVRPPHALGIQPHQRQLRRGMALVCGSPVQIHGAFQVSRAAPPLRQHLGQRMLCPSQPLISGFLVPMPRLGQVLRRCCCLGQMVAQHALRFGHALLSRLGKTLVDQRLPLLA